jgi:hypothetical protein
MGKFFAALFFVFLMLPGFGQTINPKNTLYRCVVVDQNGSKTIGALYALEDSVILLLDMQPAKDGKRANWLLPVEPMLRSIEVDKIVELRFRKAGASKTRAIEFGAIGMVAGGGIGSLSNPMPKPYEKYAYGFESFQPSRHMLVGAAIGAILGAGTGLMTTTVNTRISINGDRHWYGLQRDELKKYLYPLSSRENALLDVR